MPPLKISPTPFSKPVPPTCPDPTEKRGHRVPGEPARGLGVSPGACSPWRGLAGTSLLLQPRRGDGGFASVLFSSPFLLLPKTFVHCISGVTQVGLGKEFSYQTWFCEVQGTEEWASQAHFSLRVSIHSVPFVGSALPCWPHSALSPSLSHFVQVSV